MPSICQQLRTLWTDIQPTDRNQYFKTQVGAFAAIAATAVASPATATILALGSAFYNAAVFYHPVKKRTYELSNPIPKTAFSPKPPLDAGESDEEKETTIQTSQKHWSSEHSEVEKEADRLEAAENELQDEVREVLFEAIERISDEPVDCSKTRIVNSDLNELVANGLRHIERNK